MITPSKRLLQLNDQYLRQLKLNWFNGSHQPVDKEKFIRQAVDWFRTTKINNIQGWDHFPCQDVMLGCTHFIESLLIKHSNNIQVLSHDYAYYTLMGIVSTELENLQPHVPLIISLPNWYYADIRPEWNDVLSICEQRNIDIHIDMAWATVARDFSIDLSHPCIKSFGMSMSKYSMEWNRIGIRWSRQRTADSITMFNRYQGSVNQGVMSCGSYLMNNLPRDYGWETHGQAHRDICKEYNLQPSKMIHVAHSTDDGVVGIAELLALRFKAPVSV